MQIEVVADLEVVAEPEEMKAQRLLEALYLTEQFSKVVMSNK